MWYYENEWNCHIKCYPYTLSQFKTEYVINEIFKYKKDLDNPNIDSFGYKLNVARKNKGLKRKTLARILGVSFVTLSRWEKSESYPPINYLQIIANTLGVSEDYLKDDYIEFISNLPEEVSNLRADLNLSAKELALKVGINNPRTVREWVSGVHVPNTKTVKKLIELKKRP